MFLPFAAHRAIFKASAVTFALVRELFSNVSKVSGAHAHLLNCCVRSVFIQTSPDTCVESHVHEEATHEKHFETGGPFQKALIRPIRGASW